MALDFSEGYYLWRILVPKGEKCMPVFGSEYEEESEIIFKHGKILKFISKEIDEQESGMIYDIILSGETKEELDKYYDKNNW